VAELERKLKIAGIDMSRTATTRWNPSWTTPSPSAGCWRASGSCSATRRGGWATCWHPKSPPPKEKRKEAVALYRDAVLFWLMVAHPLRAKHYYGARLDMNEFRDGDFTPGRGHVGRAGGGYYLAYRKSEFKNARSQVFQSLQDHGSRPRFPWSDPEHPHLVLDVDGKRYSLNELFHVYLHTILPRLAQALGRTGPLLPLFPGRR
jgi:hypothetical protein